MQKFSLLNNGKTRCYRVKYVKVVKLNNGSISLNYDHKITTDETVDIIVPHIINTLDFAATYLQNKLNSSEN